MIYNLKRIYALRLFSCLALFLHFSDLQAQQNPKINGSGRYDAASGLPRALYSSRYAAQAGTPQDQARAYINERSAQLFGMPKLPEDMLEYLGHTTLPFGQAVRFQQVFQGIAVEGGEVVVTITHGGEVLFTTSSFKSVPKNMETQKRPLRRRLAREDAVARAAILRDENEETPGFPVRATSVWVIDAAGIWVEARRVEVYHPEHQHYWAVWISAERGDVLQKESLAVKCKHSHEAILEAKALVAMTKKEVALPFTNTESTVRVIGTQRFVEGMGKVFDPDPVTSAKQLYGAPGLSDNNDADSPELSAQLKDVVLNDLSLENGQYFLRGKYAWIADTGAPFKGLFEQSSNDFSTTRTEDMFEAVNAYYHIDKNLRYTAETLGFSIPNRHTGNSTTQWFDASALNGSDNSQYDPSTGFLVFGEGGVDDAEDAGVVWHETAHALHDRMTLGSISNATNDGLAEGFADYWTQSYIWTVQPWASTEASYHHVFRWDGHNPFWTGRTTLYPNTFPSGIVSTGGSLRERNGQILSATLMEIWPILGRTLTDKAALSAVGMTNRDSNQNDYFNAFYLVLRLMGASAAQMDQVYQILVNRGYTLPAKGLHLVYQAEESSLNFDKDAEMKVEINNNSSQTKSNVKVTVSLPSDMVYQDGNTTCPTSLLDGKLVLSIGDLAAFGFKTCSFVVRLQNQTGKRYVADDFEQGLSQWVAPKDARNFGWTANLMQPHSGKSSAFVQNQGEATDLTLTLAKPIKLQAGSPILSFWHYYNTEFYSDGGVVEVSVDGGNNWQDMDSKWIVNGYNGKITSTFATPLTNRNAFTGSSQKYLNSVADLSSYIDQSILVRFRFASDIVTGIQGWHVDDVLIADQATLASEVCLTSHEGDQVCTKTNFMVVFSTPVDAERPALPITHEMEKIWPNPFKQQANLRFRVAKPQKVNVTLHDLLGRHVGEVFNGMVQGGDWQTVKVERAALPNGVYFCRIVGEDFSEVQKMVLLR